MYSCPSCGAGLRFDITSKKLVCDYCGSENDVTSFDSLNGSKEEKYFEATRFTCTQCGAELVSANNTGATFCSFCGSSTLLADRLSNEKKPDFIIPFSKTKKDCADSYVKMMSKAIFAPNELKDPKYIDSFRGIYMPYWIYDIKQNGHFSLEATTRETTYNYEITKYFDISGDIDAEYNGFSHDASYEFSDDISEAVAPYNTSCVEDFHGSYLSGFYADISDVDYNLYSAGPIEYANAMSISEIHNKKDFRGYHISTPLSSTKPPFNSVLQKPKYALFPVWFMSYKNNDRIAYVTINGQTGKIAADIPVDTKKYITYSLALAIPIFIALNIFSFLNAHELLIFSVILSILALYFSISEINQIIRKDSGMDDKGLKSKNLVSGDNSSVLKRIFKRYGILLTIASIIISAAVFILNPIKDIFYYGAAIFAIAATCYGMLDVIKDHNILVTRKLPQFNREGGNDSANLTE